jgi:hypothetical protein
MGLWMEGLDGETLRQTTAPTTHDGGRRCVTDYFNNGTVVVHKCFSLGGGFSKTIDLNFMGIVFGVLLFVAAISGCIKIYQDTTKRLEERKKYPSHMHWNEQLAHDRKAMKERDWKLIDALHAYTSGGGGSYVVHWRGTGIKLDTRGAKIDENECADCWIRWYDRWHEEGVEEVNHQQKKSLSPSPQQPVDSSVTPLMTLKRGEYILFKE